MTDRSTSLHRAARQGDYEGVRALIAAGLDVGARNDDDDTPLRLALVHANPHQSQVVSALIRAGADVNGSNKAGWTALHAAVMLSCSLRSVEALLRAGAKIDEVDWLGRTPLHLACNLFQLEQWRDAERIANLLLNWGANPIAREHDGCTPLHGAALAGPNLTVRRLVALNVPINARDNERRTALHFAMIGEEPKVADYLVRHGAWRNARDCRGNTPSEMVDR